MFSLSGGLSIITGFVIPSMQITAFLVDLEAVAVSAIKCKPDGKKQHKPPSLLNFFYETFPYNSKLMSNLIYS